MRHACTAFFCLALLLWLFGCAETENPANSGDLDTLDTAETLEQDSRIEDGDNDLDDSEGNPTDGDGELEEEGYPFYHDLPSAMQIESKTLSVPPMNLYHECTGTISGQLLVVEDGAYSVIYNTETMIPYSAVRSSGTSLLSGTSLFQIKYTELKRWDLQQPTNPILQYRSPNNSRIISTTSINNTLFYCNKQGVNRWSGEDNPQLIVPTDSCSQLFGIGEDILLVVNDESDNENETSIETAVETRIDAYRLGGISLYTPMWSFSFSHKRSIKAYASDTRLVFSSSYFAGTPLLYLIDLSQPDQAPESVQTIMPETFSTWSCEIQSLLVRGNYVLAHVVVNDNDSYLYKIDVTSTSAPSIELAECYEDSSNDGNDGIGHNGNGCWQANADSGVVNPHGLFVHMWSCSGEGGCLSELDFLTLEENGEINPNYILGHDTKIAPDDIAVAQDRYYYHFRFSNDKLFAYNSDTEVFSALDLEESAKNIVGLGERLYILTDTGLYSRAVLPDGSLQPRETIFQPENVAIQRLIVSDRYLAVVWDTASDQRFKFFDIHSDGSLSELPDILKLNKNEYIFIQGCTAVIKHFNKQISIKPLVEGCHPTVDHLSLEDIEEFNNLTIRPCYGLIVTNYESVCDSSYSYTTNILRIFDWQGKFLREIPASYCDTEYEAVIRRGSIICAGGWLFDTISKRATTIRELPNGQPSWKSGYNIKIVDGNNLFQLDPTPTHYILSE